MTMKTEDLFSFLDETPASPAESADEDVDMQAPHSPNATVKRKASTLEDNAALPPDETRDEATPLNEDDVTAPVSKKPRVGSPKPMVLDDFETEAKREVAASAGLAEAVEANARLELRHQVSLNVVEWFYVHIF